MIEFKKMLHLSLDEAREELKRRWNDVELKKKIGTKLLEAIVDELKKHNVKNISLTTEYGVEWLPLFYKKNGFDDLRGSSYLKLKSEWKKSDVVEKMAVSIVVSCT